MESYGRIKNASRAVYLPAGTKKANHVFESSCALGENIQIYAFMKINAVSIPKTTGY
jgi:hypothetical protein